MRNRPVTSPPPVSPASRAQVDRFLRGLQEFRPQDDKPVDEAAVKRYLDKMTVGSQQSIARRIMMDIMKSTPSETRDKLERKRKPTTKGPTKKKASPKAASKQPRKARPAAKKKKRARRR